MQTVYVQNKEGEPLMPTTRCGHVRYLLDHKLAKVVIYKPFTIRLKYDTPNITQELYGGTDPGRTNTGNAVTDEDGNCVYHDKVETRNKDIPKGMAERKAHRQARRRGERQVRKRLAKKHNTYSTKLANGRLIPGTKKPVMMKDIKNQEARFQNRKKKRLITPTVNQLIETHLGQVDNIRKILPVKKWCLEANRFAFMSMKDGSVQGVDFQNGRLKGYASAEEFVYERQDGKCYCCGGPIEHYHHIRPRSEGGSDGPENLVGICNDCHAKIHTGKAEFDLKGYAKKYGALSALNQAIPYIYQGLVERFGEDNVFICSGRDTKDIRKAAGLDKDHDIDALCIASIMTDTLPNKPKDEAYAVRQFRRHDRAKIKSQTERTYKLNGVVVAKNRKPRFEQKGPALSQWYEEQVGLFGKKEADRMLSQLTVKKSYRRYNDPGRLMPGAVIRYKNAIGILTSQQNKGYYYIITGIQGRVPSRDCKILRKNCGLVYM